MRLISQEKQPIVVAFTNAGVPEEGLTPEIAIIKLSDLSEVTPVDPTMFSIVGGLYQLSLARLPSITDDTIAWSIDGGDTLDPADRYKFGVLVFGGELETRIDAIDSSLSTIEGYTDTLEAGQSALAVSVAGVGAAINAVEAAIPTGMGRDVDGIDHDYGGTDNLRALDDQSSPIPNANIHIYLKTDWDAGNRDNLYWQTNGAWSETESDGRWKYQVSLNAGTYVMVVQIPGHTEQTTTEFTVT